MATIVRLPGKNGQLSYRVQVHRKGAPPLSATLTKLSEARKWVQVTEAAIVENCPYHGPRHSAASYMLMPDNDDNEG